MDSLLEALKTGSAFSHKPRRKAPARGAAGKHYFYSVRISPKRATNLLY